MRIAVPMSGGKFNQHFGQSTAFWICDVQPDTKAISNAREVNLPGGGGCGVIPGVLAQAGASLVIAGGMGAGAQANLARFGIETVTGAVGTVPQQIVEDYLAGRLVSSGELCGHHGEHGHEHGHAHRHGEGEGCCGERRH